MNRENNFKCGMVAFLGEPNVGKSSLMNALVGEPVSIVTDLAGTTREEVRGYLTGDNYQIIFLDTPGMSKSGNCLDKFMSKSISHAVQNADIICYVLDANDIKDEYIQKIRNYENKKPLLVAVNKTDKTNMQKLYPKLAKLNDLNFIKAIVPISCKSGQNLDALIKELVNQLPTAPAQFDAEEYTDQSTKKMCTEIIRSELIKKLQAEIPHGIAVKITRWQEKKGEIIIDVDIICEKQSHKPIIIGKKGTVLKNIGTLARKQIEKLVNTHIHLNTHVLVREKWKDKSEILDDLGYSH